MNYTLKMRDECGSHHKIYIEASSDESAIEQVKWEIKEWVNGGEWGDDGASVCVWYDLSDNDPYNDDMTDEGSIVIEIEPNHRSLIKAAGGNPDCDHDWSSEGEGGCDENPGVWSTGGTTLVFRDHCDHCGIIRTRTDVGSQRNPGKHDTVRYENTHG